MTLTEREKMISGDFYRGMEPELVKDRKNAKSCLIKFNQKLDAENHERMEIIKPILGALGKECHIEAPFYCDYASIFLSHHKCIYS